ncbi:aminopeptidase A [Bisgaardia hudsonensis]|uniref:Probable cytosol aminopeptidase n=1 Tax=Bisgaardia hudsonensis TaxID=109472 RepID=A0A4R2N348_9PAST|nr:leucyl aminopeptidase [Bisgaardia hudsonensis]QLB12758.1 leucyl aminopeptidase [Bisgaardia hudsonensis]TCP14308.1 aminopeptidase A [Bisgaardia hudsonensis]
MKYIAKNIALSESKDSIVVAIFENGTLSKNAQILDDLTDGAITKLVQSNEVKGIQGEILTLRHLPNYTAQRVFVVGCGKKSEITERQYKILMAKLIAEVKKTQTVELVNYLTEIEIKDRDLSWNIRFAIEMIEESLYRFDTCKSKKSDESAVLNSVIFDIEEKQQSQAEQAIKQAQSIALGVSLAKDVANLPPNICTPVYLAEQAKALAKKSPLIKTTIIGEKQMAELGMTSYLAVSQGSCHEAQMSIIEYRNHPNPNAKPIVLVGKGLTFDAGGISLKPGEGMDEMKYDMCGAASVYGVMNAIAELQLPLNIIGILAGCENLPDGNAYRPGDIITTMKGLTVEVLNTDAEGRLVLCDALTYVERFDPELVVDIATLTGACVVALGAHNSGLISSDETLAEDLLVASKETTDKAWRLPLSEEYQEQLKSNFADLANIGGRWGGAITAGAFLANFTDKYRWAHLDIAGTAWKQGAEKGATGRPVSLLTQFLINQAK